MSDFGLHWLDLVILAGVGAALVAGAVTGVVKQATWLVTYILSVYSAAYLHEPLRGSVNGALRDTVPEIPRAAAAVATFLIVYVALWAVSRLLRKAVKKMMPKAKTLSALGLR